jgi:hypothetical protein
MPRRSSSGSSMPSKVSMASSQLVSMSASFRPSPAPSPQLPPSPSGAGGLSLHGWERKGKEGSCAGELCVGGFGPESLARRRGEGVGMGGHTAPRRSVPLPQPQPGHGAAGQTQNHPRRQLWKPNPRPTRQSQRPPSGTAADRQTDMQGGNPPPMTNRRGAAA